MVWTSIRLDKKHFLRIAEYLVLGKWKKSLVLMAAILAFVGKFSTSIHRLG